jgi:hypothetical protein
VPGYLSCHLATRFVVDETLIGVLCGFNLFLLLFQIGGALRVRTNLRCSRELLDEIKRLRNGR